MSNPQNNQEIFLPIKGYPRYEISNQGNVKSLNYNHTQISKILKKKTKRYERVQLYGNKYSKFFSIHRLVALHFIQNPKNKEQVNHKNGIKTDNRVENLEWVTASENIKHAFDTGLVKKLTGELNNNAKLTKEQVKQIRDLRGKITQKELSKKFKVSIWSIWSIQKGDLWKKTFKEKDFVSMKMGEYNVNAKLTKKEVLEIRGIRYKKTPKEIANKYNVSNSTIKDILTRRCWNHI